MPEIPLTQGLATLVDESDVASILDAGTWFAHNSGSHWYAARTVRVPRRGMQRLHTFLTGWPLVDHINGDGLDNRRSNLRPASAAQNNANSAMNSRNTSGYRGVSIHRATGLWRAYVGGSRDRQWLGYYHTPEEAARSRDAAALARYGAFARLNFPNGEAA